MTNQAGAITFARTYDPYGVVTATSGASQTEYGFTGESYGDSTQLLYLRARFYNPADGRFQSRDTWGGDVNRPFSMNKWSYVNGNPINQTDPTGLTPLQMGYLEGFSKTGPAFGSAAIEGSEIVYDYATMTRARFRYSGYVEGFTLSASSSGIYFGGVTGFKYEDKPLSGGGNLNSNSANLDLPYSQKIIEDYGGNTDGWYGGPSFSPIPPLPVSVTVGVGFFAASNGYIHGAYDYVSVGISPPRITLEGVTFHTKYRVDKGSLQGYNNLGIDYYYNVKTGEVNRAKLISDILSGDHSPIRGGMALNLTAWVGGSRNSQISAALIAARRFEKYYYRPEWAQCSDRQPDPQPFQPFPNPFSDPFPSLP